MTSHYADDLPPELARLRLEWFADLSAWRKALDRMMWRMRAHFYAKGCSHKGVDGQIHAILTKPGPPDWQSFKHIRDQRKAEGLKP